MADDLACSDLSDCSHKQCLSGIIEVQARIYNPAGIGLGNFRHARAAVLSEPTGPRGSTKASRLIQLSRHPASMILRRFPASWMEQQVGRLVGVSEERFARRAYLGTHR